MVVGNTKEVCQILHNKSLGPLKRLSESKCECSQVDVNCTVANLCPNHTKLKVHFFAGELVSHGDFRDGPSLSNLYDNAEDDHNLHCDIHVWTHGVHHQKTCDLSTWLNFAAPQLF